MRLVSFMNDQSKLGVDPDIAEQVSNLHNSMTDNERSEVSKLLQSTDNKT